MIIIWFWYEFITLVPTLTIKPIRWLILWVFSSFWMWPHLLFQDFPQIWEAISLPWVGMGTHMDSQMMIFFLPFRKATLFFSCFPIGLYCTKSKKEGTLSLAYYLSWMAYFLSAGSRYSSSFSRIVTSCFGLTFRWYCWGSYCLGCLEACLYLEESKFYIPYSSCILTIIFWLVGGGS